MIPLLDMASRPRTDADRLRALIERLRQGGLQRAGAKADVRKTVGRIIAAVAARGPAAVCEYTRKFDRARMSPGDIRVPQQALQEARRCADPEFMKLIARSAANVRAYQRAIMVRPPKTLTRGGRQLGVRYTPVDRVGVYVPGGRAFYPSTVLMTVIPAQVAGVREIAIASPPTGGDVNPMVLAIAAELGIGEVYRMGGAQAVAAMALAEPSWGLKPVDMIVGPGNAFVAEAKRQLLGVVGIDSIAGPSEVLILADASARADLVAADMLAQAEHDPGSAILVTWSRALAKAVIEQLRRQLPLLERAGAAAAALAGYSAVVVTRDMPSACDIANQAAPEHMQIIARDERAAMARVRHAGAIFVGQDTPVPLGDYFAGPSHVLPTGGTARFFGALSCNSFLKATSTIRYNRRALAADAADVAAFARREGLTAHARAVEMRLKRTK